MSPLLVGEKECYGCFLAFSYCDKEDNYVQSKNKKKAFFIYFYPYSRKYSLGNNSALPANASLF